MGDKVEWLIRRYVREVVATQRGPRESSDTFAITLAKVSPEPGAEVACAASGVIFAFASETPSGAVVWVLTADGAAELVSEGMLRASEHAIEVGAEIASRLVTGEARGKPDAH